jgi:hypothetical protein
MASLCFVIAGRVKARITLAIGRPASAYARLEAWIIRAQGF